MKPSRSERRGLSWSPLLSAGAMGCCVGYLVASLIMGHRCPWYEPIGVVLDDSPKSKTQFATRSATELQKNNDEKQQQQQGWNKVHVYYGKPDHLEILTPMAQAKQDEHVAAMLSHKKGGFFVDLAANDATYLSNTYALERDYEWNGLCIEPNPIYWRRLSYRRCEVVAAVVGRTSNEEIRFHLGNDGALGGIVKEGFDNDPRKGNLDSSKVSSYYTVTLGELLDHMKAPTVIDYLGLDVEGAEFYLMRDFPFDRYVFKILTIERPKAELVELLQQNGYERLCEIATFGETLWVHQRHKPTLDLKALPGQCHGR